MVTEVSDIIYVFFPITANGLTIVVYSLLQSDSAHWSNYARYSFKHMRRGYQVGNCICILSTDERQTEQLRSLLCERHFEARVFLSLDSLMKGLGNSGCLAAIMDVDSVQVTNRMIRQIKRRFSKVSIFCTSEHRHHPDLKDAFSQHIYACLKKPLDPDELDFWLKCVRDNELVSRAPP